MEEEHGAHQQAKADTEECTDIASEMGTLKHKHFPRQPLVAKDAMNELIFFVPAMQAASNT